MSGSWQAERGRLSREDPRAEVGRAEVGEDVRVGVGPMEFKLNRTMNRSMPTHIKESTSSDKKGSCQGLYYFQSSVCRIERMGFTIYNLGFGG